jgi:hypothetical protein
MTMLLIFLANPDLFRGETPGGSGLGLEKGMALGWRPK